MVTHNRSQIVAVLWTPCAIPPRNRNSNSKSKCGLSILTLEHYLSLIPPYHMHRRVTRRDSRMYAHRTVTPWVRKCACTEQSHAGTHKCMRTELSRAGTHKCTCTELSHVGLVNVRAQNSHTLGLINVRAQNCHAGTHKFTYTQARLLLGMNTWYLKQAYTGSNSWMIQHDWLETTGLRKETVTASFKVLPQRLQRGAEEKDEKPQSGKQISEMKLEHRT
jgi:hypothetical protein